MIKSIIFDFDGTLVDTAPGLILTANKIFKKYNKDLIDSQQGVLIASNGITAFLKLRFTDEEIANNSLFDEFFKQYINDCCHDANFFDGFDDLLKTLKNKGILLGIVTNKPRIFTNKIADSLKINQLFDIVLCPDDGYEPKPSSEMLTKALGEMNLMPSEALYVGDGERDIIAANRINIGSVFASFGYVNPNDLPDVWGYDYCIKNPLDLLKLIN